VFQPGTRLQIVETAGTVYFTISNVTFGAGITTITVVADTNAVDSGIATVNYGIITSLANSLPILPAITKSANYTFSVIDVGQIFEFNASPSNLSCAVSNASPGVVTAANNGLSIGSQFVFGLGVGGILPANVQANTFYYPIATGFVANTSFQFSNSNGGSAINTTGVTSSNVTISQCLTATLPTANTFPSNGTLEIKNISQGPITVSGTIDGNANGAILTQYGFSKVFSDGNAWYSKQPLFTSAFNQVANITVSNGSTSVVIPSLTPGNKYKIILNLMNSNANNSNVSFIFNNDSSANYAFESLYWTGSGAFAANNANSAANFVPIVSPTNRLIANGSYMGEWLVQNQYGSTKNVFINTSGSYWAEVNGPGICFTMANYTGAANLSNMTVQTSNGAFSGGTITVYQLN
jgi:hypothetical protein